MGRALTTTSHTGPAEGKGARSNDHTFRLAPAVEGIDTPHGERGRALQARKATESARRESRARTPQRDRLSLSARPYSASPREEGLSPRQRRQWLAREPHRCWVGRSPRCRGKRIEASRCSVAFEREHCRVSQPSALRKASRRCPSMPQCASCSFTYDSAVATQSPKNRGSFR